MLDRAIAPGVTLRLPEERDIDELHALVLANRDHLVPWMPWAIEPSRDGGLEWIRRARRRLGENQGLETLLEIDGAIAGSVGVHRVNQENGNCEIGYWLADRHQGRGAMTAAVRAFAGQVFEAWELERMELRAGVENTRSRAVAERVGFTQEGVLRHGMKVGERWLDVVVYGLLAEEWRAVRPEPS